MGYPNPQDEPNKEGISILLNISFSLVFMSVTYLIVYISSKPVRFYKTTKMVYKYGIKVKTVLKAVVSLFDILLKSIQSINIHCGA